MFVRFAPKHFLHTINRSNSNTHTFHLYFLQVIITILKITLHATSYNSDSNQVQEPRRIMIVLIMYLQSVFFLIKKEGKEKWKTQDDTSMWMQFNSGSLTKMSNDCIQVVNYPIFIIFMQSESNYKQNNKMNWICLVHYLMSMNCTSIMSRMVRGSGRGEGESTVKTLLSTSTLVLWGREKKQKPTPTTYYSFQKCPNKR